MRDRGRRNPDAGIDDHGAGSRIDDHPRRRIGWRDLEVLDGRDQTDACRLGFRCPHANRHRIVCDCDAGAEQCVDAVRQPYRSREIRPVQVQRQHFGVTEYRWYFTLDSGPVRHATDTGYVDRNLRAVFTRETQSTDGQVALCDGVDLAVQSLEWCEQQRATAQALGIGDR